MKIRILLFSCLSFLFINSHLFSADNFWGIVPSCPTESYRAITIDSSGVVIAAQWGGVIVKSTNAGSNWSVLLGTGLTNTFVNAIESAPNGTIWAGTYGGGVFSSSDGGANWTAKNTGLPNLIIKAITITPRGHIFIGTMGNGIYRSTDGGSTWKTSTSTIWYFDINTLINVSDSIIVAGTSNEYIYRSTNNGDTWTKVMSGFSNKTITCFAKNRLEELYCGTLEDGVFYSVDKGVSWSKYYPEREMPHNITCLAMATENEPVAGTNDSGMKKYDIIYDSWRLALNVFGNGGVNSIVANSAGILYASCPQGGIYKSTNTGLNWVSVYPVNALAGTFVVGAAKNGVVYSANHTKGIYKSTDYGISWNKTSFDEYVVYQIGFDSTNNIYATALGAVYKSSDGGNVWDRSAFGTSGKNMIEKRVFAYNLNGFLLGADTSLFKSTDNGVSWERLSVSYSAGMPYIGVNRNGDIYVQTSDGVKKSTDNGTSWVKVKSKDTLSYAIDFNSQGHIYLGTNKGLCISTNNGASWTTQNFGMSNPAVDKIVITKHDSVYISFSFGKGILKSNDNFQSYRTCNSGVNLANVRDLAVSPDNYLYIGTDVLQRAVDSEDMFQVTAGYPSLDTSGTVLNPTLSWNTTKDATMYELQISKFNDFSSPEEKVVIKNTEWKLIRPLSNYTKYFWRVRGKYNSTMGPWSNLKYFTTIIADPVLKYPQNNSRGHETTITMLWYSVSGATDYTLQVSKDSNFASFVVNKALIEDTSYQVKGLSLLTKYYWRVMAKQNKSESGWSEVWNFTTKLKPPVLRSPADKSVNMPIALTMTWDSSETSTGCNIQIARDKDFAQMFFDGTAESKTSHSVELLEYYTDYWWRVNARNEDATSDYSEAWQFTTMIDKPVLLSPADSLKNQAATLIFKWSKFGYNCKYHIQISTDENFGTIFYEDTQITADSLEYSGLTFNSKFYWRVRIIADNSIGMWSDARVFWTSIDRPTLKMPENNKTDVYPVTLDFKWNAVVGAKHYYIQLSKDAMFNSLVWFKDSVTVLTERVYDLENYQKYYWRVRASFDDGFGDWSEFWNFTTSDPNGVFDELTKQKYTLKVYPNPFSSDFTVSYNLKNNCSVKIELIDNSGKTVANLFDDYQTFGDYNMVFRPQPIAAGIYYIKISFGGDAAMEKIIYTE